MVAFKVTMVKACVPACNLKNVVYVKRTFLYKNMLNV